MNLGFSEEINGNPSFFVEKIWASISFQKLNNTDKATYQSRYKNQFGQEWAVSAEEIKPKLHTIRSGKRWQANDLIHFIINRNKTDFQFAPDLRCQSVQDIEINYFHPQKQHPVIYIDGKQMQLSENQDLLYQLAVNDGFNTVADFFAYFKTNFVGQIVHWTNLKY